VSLLWFGLLFHTTTPPRNGTKENWGKTHLLLSVILLPYTHLWHSCAGRVWRPKAIACCSQTFATSTAHSCATLPLQKPGGQQRGCQQRTRRVQSPDVARCSARVSLLLPGTGASPPSRVLFFPPVLSFSCSYYRLLVITYFATSSSTKSLARVALVLGGGNYLTEIIKSGALVASTLPAKLIVLTAGADSWAAALLSRKPRLVSDN